MSNVACDCQGNQTSITNGWGYDLVRAKIAEGRGNTRNELDPLFECASDHETCFLEFKATPFKPEQSCDMRNPYGSKPGETEEDYAWNVAKAILALANTAGGAVILGITDKGHSPIPDICKLWAHNWDEFSRNLFSKILRTTYAVVTAEKSWKRDKRIAAGDGGDLPKHHLELTPQDRDKLCSLCELVCCHYQGEIIPVILVKTGTPDLLIYARNSTIDGEVLYVRSKGDQGKTSLLKGRALREYERPDSGTYQKAPPSASPSPKRYWNNLQKVNEFFGRTDDLVRLKNLFDLDKHVWISGEPGVGKTSFIQKFIDVYCKDDADSTFDIAFFLDAQGQTFAQIICKLCGYRQAFKKFSGVEMIGDGANSFADLLCDPDAAKPHTFKLLAQRVIERLNTYSGPGRILIVLDNVESSDCFKDPGADFLLRTASDGCVRFCATSRQPTDDSDVVKSFPLEHMSMNDALDILDSKRHFSTPQEKSAAEEIVKSVDHNAWALSQIATLLGKSQEPTPYARQLEELNRRGGSFGPDGLTERLEALYAPTLDRLENPELCGGSEAFALFQLSSWFPSDAIPCDWLETAFDLYLKDQSDLTAPRERNEQWRNNINVLINEGMITWWPEDGSFTTPRFVQDVLRGRPETYRLWPYVFETIKRSCSENAGNGDFWALRYQTLLDFIELTVNDSTSAIPDHASWIDNARELVIWLAASPRWRHLLRQAVKNYGNVPKIQRICKNLLRVAEGDYNRDRVGRSGHVYLFFLSLQKSLVSIWEQNIRKQREISKELRTVFQNLSNKTENEELDFSRDLMTDARQNVKLCPFPEIRKDLDQALEILHRYKSTHPERIFKCLMERAVIELQFREYGKMGESLELALEVSRSCAGKLPGETIKRYCKEQQAYIRLCQGLEAKGPWFWRRFWRNLKLWRSKTKYEKIINKIKEENDPGNYILFEAFYFIARVHLATGKTKDAEDALNNAFNMCEHICNGHPEVKDREAVQLAFNMMRVQAGIRRLQERFDEAQSIDRMAFEFYDHNISDQGNLDLADLEDDYGNTYAMKGNFSKAIEHVQNALDIRQSLLPPSHEKVLNSYNRLAYLHGILAMKSGETALGFINDMKEVERLPGPSKSLLKDLKRFMKFDRTKEDFLEGLRKDEISEESERVRSVITHLQEIWLDDWLSRHKT